MKQFISVREADEAIAAAIPDFGLESVPLHEAHGRILREDLFADRDLPPFDRVTMDGVALRTADWTGGCRRFRLAGVQRAGMARLVLAEPETCIEVMTGAVLPEGCDAVVRVEDLHYEDGTAVLSPEAAPRPGQFIHPQGSDVVRGARLLVAGSRLDAAGIAVAASVGRTDVLVATRPSVTVLSTGDELVEVGEPIEPHQIRMSNPHMLAAGLRLRGFSDVRLAHVPDDPARLEAAVRQALDSTGVLILTGGVSMGQFDYVPQVMQALRVTPLFHKVRQRPGKPLWFGVGEQGTPVFALPGNPVSAAVGLYRYVLPHLERAMGLSAPAPERAALAEPVTFKPDLTYFLPVTLSPDESGRLLATPRPTNTSGDFAALAGTAGFLELEAERDHFPAGHVAPLHRWSA